MQNTAEGKLERDLGLINHEGIEKAMLFHL